MSSTIEDRTNENRSGLEDAFESLTKPAYLVAPTHGMLSEVVSALSIGIDAPPINILGTTDVLKTLRDDFALAVTAADLKSNGRIEIRALDGQDVSSMLSTDDSLKMLLRLDEETHLVGGETSDADTVATVHETVDELWAGSEKFSLRKPARSTMIDTLSETFSDEVAADFDALLEGVVDSDQIDNTEVDGETVALLVAAKHGLQLYDIGKWSEDIGLRSKATISRTKGTMEDLGVIETASIPAEIGRPRQQLLLTDEYSGASIEELVSLVAELE